jgi:ABC-type lipoprotein export system ATPase subunit
MGGTPALETRVLTKVYGQGETAVHALDGVSLEIARGEMAAIMGPSGSGKSTLLHLLGALDTPSSGEILLAGQRYDGLGDGELTRLRREKIGFVFQFFNLLPSLTAEENVLLPALIAGRRDDAMRTRAKQLLDRVGLAQRAIHLPAELSGGEQQRVSIARAFVNHPPLLICDEPTGNLDPDTSVGIMQLLYRINRTGTTVVMATHDREMVDKMRKRVIALDNGDVIRDERRGQYTTE